MKMRSITKVLGALLFFLTVSLTTRAEATVTTQSVKEALASIGNSVTILPAYGLQTLGLLSWSPDGSQFAVVGYSFNNTVANLYRCTVKKALIQNCALLDSMQAEGDKSYFFLNPVFSPNGKRIAYLKQRYPEYQIILNTVQADGTDKPRSLATLSPSEISFAWTPDSQGIGYASIYANGIYSLFYAADYPSSGVSILLNCSLASDCKNIEFTKDNSGFFYTQSGKLLFRPWDSVSQIAGNEIVVSSSLPNIKIVGTTPTQLIFLSGSGSSDIQVYALRYNIDISQTTVAAAVKAANNGFGSMSIVLLNSSKSLKELSALSPASNYMFYATRDSKNLSQVAYMDVTGATALTKDVLVTCTSGSCPNATILSGDMDNNFPLSFSRRGYLAFFKVDTNEGAYDQCVQNSIDGCKTDCSNGKNSCNVDCASTQTACVNSGCADLQAMCITSCDNTYGPYSTCNSSCESDNNNACATSCQNSSSPSCKSDCCAAQCMDTQHSCKNDASNPNSCISQYDSCEQSCSNANSQCSTEACTAAGGSNCDTTTTCGAQYTTCESTCTEDTYKDQCASSNTSVDIIIANGLDLDLDGVANENTTTGAAQDACVELFSVAGLMPDSDKDGLADACDNCPNTITPNVDQSDINGNGIGDVCDVTTPSLCVDRDGDSYIGYDKNNCPTGSDCDDSNAAIIPTPFYKDADLDGFGDASKTQFACAKPSGYVDNNKDCDDTRSYVHVGAMEVCDGLDNNCDGQIDEGSPQNTYYQDLDSDGFGSAEAPNADGSSTVAISACAKPVGYAENNKDCNDAVASISPAAVETCDGQDNNCDGKSDEGFSTNNYYPDADGDSYGSDKAELVVIACSQPYGYVTNNADCVDTNVYVHPGLPELCNDGLNNDCIDGTVDNQCQTSDPNFNYDVDADGYATNATGSKYDCNDVNPNVHPGATELCDGIDNNCDKQVDEGLSVTYYADADGDGYGDANAPKTACARPYGYVENSKDCNDDPAKNGLYVNPSIAENCSNEIDDNCNGQTNENCAKPPAPVDLDNDKFTSADGDCNDYDPTINPKAPEICDGKDNNCNGQIDEAVQRTYYADTDGDSYGDATITALACDRPYQYAELGTDCNDKVASTNPGAAEMCDSIDNNCNTQVDEACADFNSSPGTGSQSAAEAGGSTPVSALNGGAGCSLVMDF